MRGHGDRKPLVHPRPPSLPSSLANHQVPAAVALSASSRFAPGSKGFSRTTVTSQPPGSSLCSPLTAAPFSQPQVQRRSPQSPKGTECLQSEGARSRPLGMCGRFPVASLPLGAPPSAEHTGLLSLVCACWNPCCFLSLASLLFST